MNRVSRLGFTLIELLTVIAIIAILAGMTFTVFPRVRERAQITKAKNIMAQINTSLTNYFASHNSFPPTYGYIRKDVNLADPSLGDDKKFYLEPYTVPLQIYDNLDMYDNFSESYDTDRDQKLNLMEFMPVGDKGQFGVKWLDVRYNGTVTPQVQPEITRLQSQDIRPLIYVPVNARQAALVRRYWIQSGDEYARNWDRTNPLLANLQFPPPTYDAFVLISVGPGGTTGGVAADLPTGVQASEANDIYHIAALRTYFLATRDLNLNNVLDFEFEARSGQGEGAQTYQYETMPNQTKTTSNENLPGSNPPANPPVPLALYGPLIYVSK